MINVANKRCIFEGCTKRRIYNVKGVKTPIYCFTHKKEDMLKTKNAFLKDVLNNLFII